MKDKNLQIVNHRVNKTASYAILLVVLLAVTGSLYALFANRGFLLSSPQSFIVTASFHLSNAITIGGGFVLGYLIVSNRKNSRVRRVVIAGTIALLATALYSLVFMGATRFLASPGMGEFDLLVSLVIALAGAVVMAFIARRPTSAYISRPLRYAFLGAFWLYQVIVAYKLLSAYIIRPTDATFALYPIWLQIPSLILMPIITALVLLAALRIPQVKHRLFYASLFGALIYYFLLQLWQFETDPRPEAVNAFTLFADAISIALLLAVILLILRSTKLLRKQHVIAKFAR